MAIPIKKAQKLVSIISPNITPRRHTVLATAIKLVADSLQQGKWDQLHFITDVYQVVAQIHQISEHSAQKMIFRSVEDCWMGGDNQLVHAVIGCRLPLKPKPSEFLLYCAYYLCYDYPYHADHTGLPLPVTF